jgi:hypothetical protein
VHAGRLVGDEHLTLAQDQGQRTPSLSKRIEALSTARDLAD